MTGAGTALIAAGAALLALLLGAGILLRAWQGWLELKRLRLAAGLAATGPGEVQQLRARVRILERIALGLD